MQLLQRYTLLFFTMLYLSLPAMAQDSQLTGFVKDAISGNAIEGATVTLLKSADSSSKRNMISAKNGSFRFMQLPAGGYLLRVSSSGYQPHSTPVEIKENNNQPFVILLTIESRELAEVVIKAENNQLIEQKTDRLVVNVNALSSNAGSSAFDVLNAAPGVLINEQGSMSLKGREGVLVYMDNKPSLLSGTDLINYLKTLPSSMLDKIELISNPSSRYSAEGSGGIIHIRTKKIRARGWSGNTSLSYTQGYYARTSNSAMLNYRYNKLNILGTASYSYNVNYYDVYRDRRYDYPGTTDDYAIYKDIHEKSDQGNFRYKLAMEYELTKKTSAGFFFSRSGNPYRERGHYKNIFTGHLNTTDSLMQSYSSFRSRPVTYSYNADIRHQFNKSHELSIALDHFTYRNQTSQDLKNLAYDPGGSLKSSSNLLSLNPFSAKVYSIKADYAGKPGGMIEIEAGIQFTHSGRNNRGVYFDKTGNTVSPVPSLNNAFDLTEAISAVYTSFKKDINRLSFQAGLRMEQTTAKGRLFDLAAKPDSSFTIRYTSLFPTFYTTYKLDSAGKQTLNFSFGRRITRPNYSDLNPSMFFFDPNTTNTGNNLLQPQFAGNAELTYNYNGKIIAGLLYSHTKNSITQVFRQEGNVFISSFLNVRSVKSMGFTLNLTIKPAKWWTMHLYQEIVNMRNKGMLFGHGESIDNAYTAFRFNGLSQFQLGNGWRADINVIYRSGYLSAQSMLKTLCQFHAGAQKKLSDKATVSLSVRDLFHSWKIRREVIIPHVNAYFSSLTDTQTIGLAFMYRLGNEKQGKERKSGVQSELQRVQ